MYQPLVENVNHLLSNEQNGHKVVFSSLSDYYQPVQSQGFAIKYVINGIERYTLNGQKYPVETGKYLLSNSTHHGHVEIESRQHVKSICINLVPSLLAEIVASHLRPDTAYSDLALGQFFSSYHFLENQYEAKYTRVGQLLIGLESSIQINGFGDTDWTLDFFYALSESLIADQLPVFRQLQAIPSIKSATKKDLLKRIFRGKELMDSCFALPLSIELIAQEACLSEYHFFRLFKSVFGTTPHQYLIQKRLERAHGLLQKERSSVSMAAIESGFTDIFTFSKAFKKQFGHAPSAISKQI